MMRESKEAYEKRTQWFRESRFGMFIHWNLFSLLERGCLVMYGERIPVAEYAKLADRFNPRKFDADAWANLAAEAGMKYMVLTTRHHEGFCLWDSQVSEFTSVKTAAKRDFVAEYVEACRRAGLRVGFYYSLCDWRFPGYFERQKYRKNAEACVKQAHDQVRELLTSYGKIDILWFDGHWFSDKLEWIETNPEPMRLFWKSDQLVAMVRKLQPHILINDRSGLAGDYDTPEQYVKASKPGRVWESCMTITDHFLGWSYVKNSPVLLSTTKLLQLLITAAHFGGNFLLNVGPKPDGVIPAQEQKRLQEIGKWMKINGEAIYGSESSPLGSTVFGEWTIKGNTGYLHVFRWPGKEAVAPGVGTKVKSAKILSTGQKVEFYHDCNGRLVFHNLPIRPPDPHVSVIKVEFEQKPKPYAERDWAAWLEGKA